MGKGAKIDCICIDIRLLKGSGMEFKFSKQEELWQWAVREFTEGEFTKQELVTLDYVPTDLLKKMGELGFFSLQVPKEYGGHSGTWVMIGMLAEEIAKKL